MTDLLPLAKKLKGLDPEALAALMQSAGASSVGDLLDLAKMLLTKRELEKRIRRLSANELELLGAGAESPSWEANFLGIKKPFPDAIEVLNQLQPIPLKFSQPDEHGPAIAAYETLLAVTELIFACERRLLTAVRSGLRVPDAKEIGETLKMTPARLQLRFQLALEAGLILAHQGRFAATESGLSWLAKDNQSRWQQLAATVWDLPPIKAGGDLIEALLAEFPLADLNQLKFLRFAEILGLTDQGVPTEQFASASGDWIARQLPEVVESFVIQTDLSVLSLGPLSPALHRQLDVIAQPEDLGLATRFRLTPQTICHALETGMSAAQVLEFLQQNSKGPLPQPVSYLISDVEQKFGRLTVSDTIQGCLIKSPDRILLRQIVTQASLRPLLLEIRDQGLYSRLDKELVYFNLRAAGYLAVMADAAGKVVSPRVQIISEVVSGFDYLALAQRLLTEDARVPEGDDVMRQLQFALKNKLKVGLRVGYPDGSEKEHLIEPLGVGGGRVRGRDSVKQAEVTLPLSRIIAIWLA